MLKYAPELLKKYGIKYKSNLLPSPAKYIYFRSDTREPKEVFKYGFEKQEPLKAITYRTNKGISGDIDPPTAVCLTRRFDIAPLFPFYNNAPRYIYALSLDESEIFDTRLRQIKDTEYYIKQIMAKGVKREDLDELEIGWPLFAHEYATEKVPNYAIIGATQCKILGRSSDKMRVTFECGSPVKSLFCNLPEELKLEAMLRLIQAEGKGAQISPHPGTGFGGLTI